MSWASPYGRHDVAVIGGIASSQVRNPKILAQIEKDAADLVRIQQEARARLLGPQYRTGGVGDLETGREAGKEDRR